MKPLVFTGSSLADLRDFPDKARREAGYQLSQIQLGFEPTDWKPMHSIGRGVREIRIHSDGEYRVIYITRLHETIYVLHAFQKKTKKTSRNDIHLATARLKLLRDIQS